MVPSHKPCSKNKKFKDVKEPIHYLLRVVGLPVLWSGLYGTAVIGNWRRQMILDPSLPGVA